MVSGSAHKRPLLAAERPGAAPLTDCPRVRFLESWEVLGMKRLLTVFTLLCTSAALAGATAAQSDKQDDKPSLLIVSKRTGNAEIWLVNAQGKGARNLTRSNSENSYPCWSPDGKKIAFASDRNGAMNIY